MKPGADVLVELALAALPANARIADIGGPQVPTPRLAARRVAVAREDEALAFLGGHARDPLDAILAAWPSRFAPLMPFLDATHAALRDDGKAFVCDLVWRTAPTIELLRAFAPEAGREKVRPIEGYEMQIEHCGFQIDRRVDVDRARWASRLPAEQRAAVEADSRGAAKLATWVLTKGHDEGEGEGEGGNDE